MAETTITVTTDQAGRLADNSTLTYEGVTVPIPARVPLFDGSTMMAPIRIGRTARTLGLDLAPDYRDTMVHGDGYVEIRVVPRDGDWCNCQAIPGTPNYPGPWHERGGEPHHPCAQSPNASK